MRFSAFSGRPAPVMRRMAAPVVALALGAAALAPVGAAADTDTAPPVLTRVTLEPARMPVGGAVELRHTLSETARLQVTVERRRADGAARVLGSASAPAPAGAARTRLSGTRLRPGRHLVRVVAVDAAGNRSAERVARLRVVAR